MSNYRLLCFCSCFQEGAEIVTKALEELFYGEAGEEKIVDVIDVSTDPGQAGIVELWGIKQIPTIIAVRVREDGSTESEIARISGKINTPMLELFLDKVEKILKG